MFCCELFHNFLKALKIKRFNQVMVETGLPGTLPVLFSLEPSDFKERHTESLFATAVPVVVLSIRHYATAFKTF
jgi:hypothetical protein